MDIKHHNNKHHRDVCKARPLIVCIQVYRDMEHGVFVGWHKLLEIVPKMMCLLLQKMGAYRAKYNSIKNVFVEAKDQFQSH